MFHASRREFAFFMVIEARQFGLAFVFLLAPARDGDEGHVLAPRLLANLASDFVAVHFRHANVQQHNFREEVARDVEGRGAVVGRLRMMAEAAQKGGERKRAVDVVVDD